MFTISQIRDPYPRCEQAEAAGLRSHHLYSHHLAIIGIFPKMSTLPVQKLPPILSGLCMQPGSLAFQASTNAMVPWLDMDDSAQLLTLQRSERNTHRQRRSFMSGFFVSQLQITLLGTFWLFKSDMFLVVLSIVIYSYNQNHSVCGQILTWHVEIHWGLLRLTVLRNAR